MIFLPGTHGECTDPSNGVNSGLLDSSSYLQTNFVFFLGFGVFLVGIGIPGGFSMPSLLDSTLDSSSTFSWGRSGLAAKMGLGMEGGW